MVSWDDARWLVAAGLGVLVPLAAALRARWARRQTGRIAASRVWARWLGGVPASGSCRAALLALAGALAAGAAAQPRWGEPTAAPSPAREVAVALDVSASMGTADAAPDRLGRGAAVLRAAFRSMSGARVSLTAGAGEVRAVVPPTTDLAAIEAALAARPWEGALAPGSNLALLLLAAPGTHGGGAARTVLLVSDGEAFEGDAAAAAAQLRAGGDTVIVLHCGTSAGGPVPRPETRPTEYLRAADGRIAHSHADPSRQAEIAGTLEHVIDAAAPDAPERVADATALAALARAPQRPARSRLLLLGAAGLGSAAFFLWPWRRLAVVLVLTAFPSVALAQQPHPSPRAHWLRLVPGAAWAMSLRGEVAAARNDWAAAARHYAAARAAAPGDDGAHLSWATAAAIAGDEAGTRELAARCDAARAEFAACFNLGTAALVRGDADAAARALRKAVALRPDAAPAWHNLELALAEIARRAAAAPDPGAAARARLLEAAAAQALVVPRLQATSSPRAAEVPW
ncbi:MAG: VWA domain-containing protein [Acidobacteriota bacterium]